MGTQRMLDSETYDPASPKNLEDIVGNSELWKKTAEKIKNNTTSHIILVGPAGCGKSLFIKQALRGFPTLFIDCTANFGLRENRDVIRMFARGSRTKEGMMRWVVLEHADSLTSDTQAFLRRMLETTSSTTRFIFECKDGGAITEPIYSRASIITVNAPEITESIYEINRRTKYKLLPKDVETIVKYSYGNLRFALNQALTLLHMNQDNLGQGSSIIESLLAERPKITDVTNEWICWVSTVESVCRTEGVDLRDILRIGWPNNTIVSNTCAKWSRLGGSSPRTLFMNCISSLVPAEKNSETIPISV
jgi:replication-associated recombination protein RarA